MDLPLDSIMETYYRKFIELQEKLRESEEGRLKLEMQFNEMIQIFREEEQEHYRKLRNQFKKFIIEDRKRQERNEAIFRALDRIETRIDVLNSKTERLRSLRKQYQGYLDGSSHSRSVSQLRTEPTSSSTKSTFYPRQSTDYDITERSRQERLELLDQYLKSLNSHANDVNNIEYKQASIPSDYEKEIKKLDNFSERLRNKFDSDKANTIAEDIMNSIYSRHYNRNEIEKSVPKKTTNTSELLDQNLIKNTIESQNLPATSAKDKSKPSRESLFGHSNLSQNVMDTSRNSFGTIRDTFTLRNDVERSDKSQDISEDRQHKINENKPVKKLQDDTAPTFKDAEYRIESNKSIESSILDVRRDINRGQPTGTNLETNRNSESILDQDSSSHISLKAVIHDKTEFNQRQDIYDGKISSLDRTLKADDCSQQLSRMENVDNFKDKDKLNELSVKEDAQVDADGTNQLNSHHPSNYNGDGQQYSTEGKAQPQQYYDGYDNKSNAHHPHYKEPPQQQYDANGQQIIQFNNEQSMYNRQHQQYDQSEQNFLQYNENGQPIENYDENGHPIGNYDENGQPIWNFNENGQSVMNYDENGQPIGNYDENGQPVMNYNENGQPTIMRYNENGDAVMNYDKNGQPIENYDKNGHPIRNYDENGQPIQNFNENGQPIMNYDENGQPIGNYDENGQPVMNYDENGQPAIMRYNENGDAVMNYDKNGQPIGNYNENTQPVTNYDDNGQPVMNYEENGQPIGNYDEDDQPVMNYDENGQPIGKYDENGQPIRNYDGNGQPVMNYDENGQPIMRYNENGDAVMNYDENGQPIGNYNENGQLVMNYDENGQPVMNYDKNGQPVMNYDENVQPIGKYDENGQPVMNYDENGQPVMNYDETGQPIENYDENGQPVMNYDENGQPVMNYGENGQPIENYNENGQPVMNYDENGQPVMNYDGNGRPVMNYDEDGQPIGKYDENGQPVMNYDENGQPVLNYDETGQPIENYDENGQPIMSYNKNGDAVMNYDENGPAVGTYYDQNGQPISNYDVNGQPYQYENEHVINSDKVNLHNTTEAASFGEKVEPTISSEFSENTIGQEMSESNIKNSVDILDVLDTDTESLRQSTNNNKITNDSDFSNG